MHISVLLNEVVEAFASVRITSFLDGTTGAGGHAAAILSAHPEISCYHAFDQDPVALDLAREHLFSWSDVVSYHYANYENFTEHLPEEGLDGILVDLGVSSMQLDMAEKGFSFMHDGPLDMRMDPNNPLTAAEVVNSWTEGALARVFRNYGEEKRWRAAVRAIVKAREKGPLSTTAELVEVLYPVLYNPKERGKHPATRVFQALRICVNRELEVLENFLPLAIESLRPGGRLAVITFHSLEDRIVKNAFRYAASDKEDTSGWGGLFRDKEPIVHAVTRKPQIPTDKEIFENSRSRSAKLRVVEKI